MSEQAQGTPTPEPTPVTPPVESPKTPASIKDVPQDELNTFLANHKRQLQAELQAAKQKAAGFDSLQNQVQDLLNSGMIDGVEDLEDFRTNVSSTLETYRSEQERLAQEQATMTKKLETANKAAETAAAKFNKAQTLRAIADVAGSKAADDGALELIQLKLEPLAEVQADDSVLINWTMTDDDGKTVTKKVSVEEAVTSMESNPSKYRGLFKATVNGGAGGEVVDGVRRTATGDLDFEALAKDPAKYMELMQKSPETVRRAIENARLSG